MKYVLQKGEDRPQGDGYSPRLFNELPSDIPSLQEGDWKYSDILGGWVGYNLSKQHNRVLYWERINKNAEVVKE